MVKKRKLEFVKGYEVSGVPPLPHYYEEIYGHTKGLRDMGLYGDKHYFWYSKNGNGAAYYELGEQKKAADATLKYFEDMDNRKWYLSKAQDILAKVDEWVNKLASTDLSKVSMKKLFNFFDSSFKLDAEVFSYYVASQPYRLQGIEYQVRLELKKRVAGSRIDYYLSRLTADDNITKTANEELDRAKLILQLRRAGATKLRKDLLSSNQKRMITEHFNKYKTINLGDGVWELDENDELDKLAADYNKPAAYYESRIEYITSAPKKVNEERIQLEKELYLDDSTIKTLRFLTELSHTRFTLRVDGFVPLIHAMDKVTSELAVRLGYTKRRGDILWQTYDEMQTSKSKLAAQVSANEIHRRRANNDEYMLLLEDGKLAWLFDSEAGEKFRQLVPEVDYGNKEVVSGVTAEHGNLEAKATVYLWGDDMKKTLASIKKNPVLIAGQTRPAMMPIIREARGIITDEGGVTSHAAIVARELKIPTIINTHIGTKVFKTGDNVFLDAANGTARKA